MCDMKRRDGGKGDCPRNEICSKWPKFGKRLAYVDSKLLKNEMPNEAWIRESQAVKKSGAANRTFFITGPLCHEEFVYRCPGELPHMQLGKNQKSGKKSPWGADKKRAPNLEKIMREMTRQCSRPTIPGNVKLVRILTRQESRQEEVETRRRFGTA